MSATAHCIYAQTAKQRRDWVVGHYVGIQKDSTNHTPWVGASLDIIYSNSQTCCTNDDSTVSMLGLNTHIIGLDSTFLFPWGGVDPNNTGKLYSDSNLLYHYFEPGPISQGGGEYYFIGKLTQSYVGIKKINGIQAQATIYPNPANNFIQITVKSGQLTEINVFDILGSEILQSKENNIDVSALPKGVYFVRVKTTEGVNTQKVIIQH